VSLSSIACAYFRTPYAEAIVQETLRFSSLVPWGLFHNTLEEVELGGFRIPKDTLIIPNLHAVHYNPDIWGDPENFRPERFLSEDGNGKTVKRNDALLAFSAGKRVCIGEALARDQVYLFMTNILSKYQVLPDPADSEPSLVPVGAFALEPQPFTVVFKERQN
jgi:cytochrome P450 family 2 subfamily U polypeptide 1